MTLTKERQNEIAFDMLMFKYHESGVSLNPSSIKKDVITMAKKLKRPSNEMAEAAKILYTDLFNQAMEILDVMILSKDQTKDETEDDASWK